VFKLNCVVLVIWNTKEIINMSGEGSISEIPYQKEGTVSGVLQRVLPEAAEKIFLSSFSKNYST
jgi:hypothetical protein